jgi:hypothetical protein
MPTLKDSTTVTLDLKWVLLLAGLLLSAGGVGWQIRDLTGHVATLEAQQKASERALIEIGVTLKLKGQVP